VSGTETFFDLLRYKCNLHCDINRKLRKVRTCLLPAVDISQFLLWKWKWNKENVTASACK